MVAAAAVGSVILIIVFSSNPNMHLGLLGSFSSIVMFGSPLMQIVCPSPFLCVCVSLCVSVCVYLGAFYLCEINPSDLPRSLY